MNFKHIKHKRPQNLTSKHRAVKNLKIARIFLKIVNKEAILFLLFITKLFSSSQYFIYLLAQISAQKMNFSVKSFFSKCEHVRIKLRTYSHLLNKSLTKNFTFCVVNIIGFTSQSCKFFFKPNCQPLVYFTSINTWHILLSNLLFRNQFLASSKGQELSVQELLHDNQCTFRT